MNAPILAGPRSAERLLVLASGSATRRAMFEAIGLAVESLPPRVDEAEAKQSLKAEGASAAEAAEALAELKAQRVSRRAPGAFVIGADQMLECEGAWFDKPETRAGAAAQLRALSGKRHQLVSAVLVVCDGKRLWQHSGRATLQVRTLSDAFIETYLDAAGDAVLSSVGAYHFEGLGAHLFRAVEGDYHTILGLPLLPLLDFLRTHGLVPA